MVEVQIISDGKFLSIEWIIKLMSFSCPLERKKKQANKQKLRDKVYAAVYTICEI